VGSRPRRGGTRHPVQQVALPRPNPVRGTARRDGAAAGVARTRRARAPATTPRHRRPVCPVAEGRPSRVRAVRGRTAAHHRDRAGRGGVRHESHRRTDAAGSADSGPVLRGPPVLAAPDPLTVPAARRSVHRRRPRAHRAPARPWSRSFAAVALPALAVLRVLHAYAKSLPQIVAQLVRSLEVLVLAGLFALGEQTLRLFGQRRCLARALLDREPEHAVHVEEETERAALCLVVAGSRVADRGLALRKRRRGVEVVRDGGRERDADLVLIARRGRAPAGRLIRVTDDAAPFVEPVLRRFERLPGEVEALAVRRPEGEVPERERVEA